MFGSFEGENAKGYERGAKLFSFILYRHAIRDLRNLGLKGKYLDAGCGPGILTVKVSKLLGVEVLGVDISEDMINLAIRRAERERVKAKFFVGDVENDYFGEFDVVFSTYSLHHWENPEGGLKNLWKMVKPGGYIYILDVRNCLFFKHGLTFEEFSVLFNKLKGAEFIEVRKRFPCISTGLAKKKI